MIIDLASLKFWLFVVAGMLFLTPLVHFGLRRLLLAALNVGFLFVLLGRNLWIVLLFLAVLYVLLQLAGKSSAWRVAVAAIFISTLFLFVLHKLPRISFDLHVERLNPVLTAIGYSYALLRTIDLARATWERRTPPPGPVDMVNYLLPFHMLAAGPIQAWDDFVAQPKIAPPLTFDQSLTMIERIVHGLFKKYVLATAISAIFLTNGRSHGWYRLVEMNMTYLWLFLDFSAYSDIAVGIGGLLGVATPENFNRPYLARNITQYWERWHISLSMWVRRNLFFPIQFALVRRTGGRYALWCASLAIFVAFVLCGVWHGLAPRFWLWGLANAIGLVVCNLYRHWLKKRIGTKGVARYMASWPIHVVAIIITFEYIAFTIMLIASKWGGTS
jgi:D-alanyl-lipoteichoic acid acyltransferase DltB (MBOAT superfamily)